MFEQVELARHFQSLLVKEQDAERMYAGLAAEVDDPALKAQVEQLRREKQRHVALAERLLELVE